MTKLIFLSWLLLASALPAPVTAEPELLKSSHDFDFSFGTWKEHSRRLLKPLTGSRKWVEWDGKTIVHKIWDGRANMAEFAGKTPFGPLKLIALRIYNPAAGQWSINFATEKVGKLGLYPGIGEFRNGRIDFFDQEPINGKIVLVRFSVYPVSPDHMKSEQAFSENGGKSWEVNWVNEYSRIGS